MHKLNNNSMRTLKVNECAHGEPHFGAQLNYQIQKYI